MIAGLTEQGLVVTGANSEGNAAVEPGHLALTETWPPLRGALMEASSQWTLQQELRQDVERWLPEREKADLWDDNPKLPQLEETLWPTGGKRAGRQGRFRWMKQVLTPNITAPPDPKWLNCAELTFVLDSVRQRSAALRRLVVFSPACLRPSW